MLMERIKKPKLRLEQMSLFDQKPNRPKWIELPNPLQKRISNLLAQILVESVRSSSLTDDRKEVVNER